jgi:two-component system LytT family response regulator
VTGGPDGKAVSLPAQLQSLLRAAEGLPVVVLLPAGMDTAALGLGVEPAPPAAASGERPESSLERLPVRSRGRIRLLRAAEVDWIDADGNYARIHAGGESHRLRAGIAALEARLDPRRFRRVHRSTIANMERVREILVSPHGDYTLVLEAGARLAVGRSYRDRLGFCDPFEAEPGPGERAVERAG